MFWNTVIYFGTLYYMLWSSVVVDILHSSVSFSFIKKDCLNSLFFHAVKGVVFILILLIHSAVSPVIMFSKYVRTNYLIVFSCITTAKITSRCFSLHARTSQTKGEKRERLTALYNILYLFCIRFFKWKFWIWRGWNLDKNIFNS